MFRRESATKRAAPAERELAVLERRRNGRVDFRHTREHRQGPRRREHVENEIAVALMQALEQRLREYRVADPGRRDDQDFAHGWTFTPVRTDLMTPGNRAAFEDV